MELLLSGLPIMTRPSFEDGDAGRRTLFRRTFGKLGKVHEEWLRKWPMQILLRRDGWRSLRDPIGQGSESQFMRDLSFVPSDLYWGDEPAAKLFSTAKGSCSTALLTSRCKVRVCCKKLRFCRHTPHVRNLVHAWLSKVTSRRAFEGLRQGQGGCKPGR